MRPAKARREREYQRVLRLKAALEILPPRFREALLLSVTDGLPRATICERLELSAAELDDLLVQSLVRLASLMDLHRPSRRWHWRSPFDRRG